MKALEKQPTYRITLTPCPRCKAQPGSHAWPVSWLNEITIADGVQSVHALVCRRRSGAFAEIIGIRTPERLMAANTARPSWVPTATARHPERRTN